MERFCQLQPAVEVLGGSVGLLLQRAGDRLGGGIEFDPEVNRCRGHAGSIVARWVFCGISTPRMMFGLAGGRGVPDSGSGSDVDCCARTCGWAA